MGDDHLDCCAAPSLETVRTLIESSHDDELLRRCTHCGCWWFHRFHEDISFSGDDDQITVWDTRLTDEEGTAIRDSAGRPDLEFLKSRPTIVVDASGVRRTTGQPAQPFPW